MEIKQRQEITKAILVLRPNAQFVWRGDNYAEIEWLDTEQTKPTLSEVETEIANPTPIPEPTVAQKLQSVGLTVDDLKAALGL
jgi:hypothetical protein